MSDRINLLQRVSSLDMSPEFDGVSKLICNIDDDTQMVVGDDTGYTIEFDNPMMTRSILNAMLNKIRGYRYQPYAAEGALLDPAAEMGDAVSIKDMYGGIYKRSRNFSRLMSAGISAPADEEIDHEYKYETKQERKVKRQLGEVKSTLIIQASGIQTAVEKADEALSQITQTATAIDAKVTADTSENKNTFGWKLTATSWVLYANNKTVFKANKDGIEVTGSGTFTGTVTATGGKIGGFTIGSKAIYNNISEYGGTQTKGVYLGTDGIQLGQNFRVNTSGTVTAKNMVLSGTLTIGGETITAAKLRQGAERANDGYQNWNGTTNTVNSNGATWSTGAGYGYNFDSMKNGGGYAYPINASSFRIYGTQYTQQSFSFKDYYGNTRTIYYLGVASE